MNLQITKPTLLINKEIALSNLQKMQRKAKENQLIFRPHFKTHQSIDVGKWFTNIGVDKITVSSLSMAVKFAYKGFNDITIAFPVNPLEIPEINSLASRCHLNLLVDNNEVVKLLNKQISQPLGLFIEIDAGYARSGIPAANVDEIKEVLEAIDHENIKFKGFLSHFGNTYQAQSRDEIRQIFERSTAQLIKLKDLFIGSYPDLLLSIGDTPSCSVIEDLSMVDEIRPGNFIYYDVMQYLLGSCSFDQIAVAVACPVVSKRPERNEIVIYGGATQLSKDYVFDQNKNKVYGLVSRLDQTTWTQPLNDTFVCSMSQEHGVISMPKDVFDQIKIGELLAVIPVHSCLVADLLSENDLFV